MRHRVKGRKLNRNLGQRKALLRNLVSSLVEYESIKTTLAKAKAVKPLSEHLVTVAKKGDLAARRKLLAFFYSKELARKLLLEIAPRYRDRRGGYTRVLKLGPRSSDKAEMARLEFIPVEKKKRAAKSKRKAGE